jgi:hypothetical protein
MPSEWPEFGPVQKTLAEFKAAYDGFRDQIVSSMKRIVSKKGSSGSAKASSRKKKQG